jgi:hypothetical protein
MKIACPHCGRQGSLPDGTFLPNMVKCPECQSKFQPVLMGEAVMVATKVADTKECPYCSEQIQATAKKCRHCGEILDVALRATEEAKSLARDRHQPVIVNNNVSTSSSAAAAAYAGGRQRSLLRSFLRFIFVSCIVLVGGIISGLSGYTVLGGGLIVLFAFMLVIGLPIYAVRFFMRMLFG